MKSRDSLFDAASFWKGFQAAFLTLGLILAVSGSSSAQVFLSTTDPEGQTSFNLAGRWSDGLAPSSGKDYVASGTYLRSPENTSSHVFAGRSLTVQSGGAILLKNTADATIRIDNLTLNNGYVSHFGLGDSTVTLAGSLTVGASGAYLYAGNGTFWLNSATVLNGNALIWGSLNPALSFQTFGSLLFDAGGRMTLSATNNVNNVTADVNFTQAFSSVYTFNISQASSAAFIAGAGTFSRIDATFGGRFQFDLQGLEYDLGDSWRIVDNASIGGALVYGASFSVNGFVDNGSGLWTSTDGRLQFDESTGYLSAIAVPEPSATALVILTSMVFLVGARRKFGCRLLNS